MFRKTHASDEEKRIEFKTEGAFTKDVIFLLPLLGITRGGFRYGRQEYTLSFHFLMWGFALNLSIRTK